MYNKRHYSKPIYHEDSEYSADLQQLVINTGGNGIEHDIKQQVSRLFDILDAILEEMPIEKHQQVIDNVFNHSIKVKV